MQSRTIDDYAIVGDGRSAALIARDGAVEWLCWPRFDSPSVFGAALDRRAGHWRIAPAHVRRVHRRYVDDTNVLVTTFETADGELRVTDAMTVLDEQDKRRMLVPEHELVRIVECVRGEVEVEVDVQLALDYGRRARPLRDASGLGLRVQDRNQLYTLRGDAALDVRDGGASGRFRLRAGARRAFSLTYDREGPAVLPPVGLAAHQRLACTVAWWKRWASACTYQGRHRDAVVRSLLALKLLSYAPSGAVIAAPTTSLPERIGGDLNWDYRYCWLRDAALTLRAYLDVGYPAEAVAFVNWLLYTTRLTRPELRILYDVHGRTPPAEQTLDHLTGFQGSRPVRIHNAAVAQLQLDVYGEVIDAVAQLCRGGARLDRETRRMLRQFGEYVCRNWERPDQGIWEPRQEPRHHTHSRLLCWTALDRLLELHDLGELPGIPVDRFRDNRAWIRQELEARGWNPTLRSYTATLDGDTVDVSVLLLGWYGFATARDGRIRHTLARIEERLQAAPGLFHRNEESRALGEGAFGICSFWVAELLARGGGSLDEAERCFEQIARYGNDVGLFGEEIDPAGGALGNFPQAFTHVGLIGAAIAIERRRREEAERRDAPRARAAVVEARP